jgi:hypothetical protein
MYLERLRAYSSDVRVSMYFTYHCIEELYTAWYLKEKAIVVSILYKTTYVFW